MDAFTYVVGLKKDLRQRNFFLMKIIQLYFVSVEGREAGGGLLGVHSPNNGRVIPYKLSGRHWMT